MKSERKCSVSINLKISIEKHSISWTAYAQTPRSGLLVHCGTTVTKMSGLVPEWRPA